jgi:membrane-associated protease RseP (regulator of RpoE activity)
VSKAGITARTDHHWLTCDSSAKWLEEVRTHWHWPRKWLPNAALFLLTLTSTTIFGFAFAGAFAAHRPFDIDAIVQAYVRLTHGDSSLAAGLQFSIPLLLILLAHEFGHYVECQRWSVDASLPYFLPSPTLFGTLGAFIRIRSPIYTRKSLLDIGVAGPLAGFVVLVPFLVAGVWRSRLVYGAPHESFVFGAPLILRVVEWLRFPGVSPQDISLHPMAMAAWAGLLATAINLLPVGQLDGGHILYAIFGNRWHRVVSTVFVLVLVLWGFLYWAWWIWAGLMFFFGRRHPLVFDQTPLSRRRVMLGAVALLLFLLSISIVPVQTS